MAVLFHSYKSRRRSASLRTGISEILQSLSPGISPSMERKCCAICCAIVRSNKSELYSHKICVHGLQFEGRLCVWGGSTTMLISNFAEPFGSACSTIRLVSERSSHSRGESWELNITSKIGW